MLTAGQPESLRKHAWDSTAAAFIVVSNQRLLVRSGFWSLSRPERPGLSCGY